MPEVGTFSGMAGASLEMHLSAVASKYTFLGMNKMLKTESAQRSIVQNSKTKGICFSHNPYL